MFQGRFRVHTATPETITKTGTVDGVDMQVKVDGLNVELVELNGTNTFNPVFVPAELSAALDAFTSGKTAIVTVTLED